MGYQGTAGRMARLNRKRTTITPVAQLNFSRAGIVCEQYMWEFRGGRLDQHGGSHTGQTQKTGKGSGLRSKTARA